TSLRIITAETKAEMKRVLKDIQTGKFTSDWMQEWKAGSARFKVIRRLNDAHQIDKDAGKLPAMMPWTAKNKLADKARNYDQGASAFGCLQMTQTPEPEYHLILEFYEA